MKTILDRVYVEGADLRPVSPPTASRPCCATPCPSHDVVKVDLHVPGCPPKPSAIAYVLSELLEGASPTEPDRTIVKFG